MRTPSACSSDEFCNAQTRRCETLDCTSNRTLCTTTQRCNVQTKRCEVSAFVLGQPDVGKNLNTAYGMKDPWSAQLWPDPADSTKTRLVVADTDNARVLMWNDVPTAGRPPDRVFGMPDAHTVNINVAYDAPREYSMNAPWSVATAGDTLIVGDYAWSRVLIWNQVSSLPLDPLPPASVVWGHSTFTDVTPNNGQLGPNQLGVTQPRVYADNVSANGGFYITDTGNNRVLVFAGVPTSFSQPPTAVIGQLNFMTNFPGVSATKLNGPRGVVSDGTLLFVSDRFNHRVLAYDLVTPFPSSPTAKGVWGQADFVSGLANRGAATSALTLFDPSGVVRTDVGAQHRLFVADAGNHRVLGYDLPATTASLVLGQPDFAANQPNQGSTTPTASTLNSPTDVWSDGQRLVVSDYNNRRVLIWRSLPQAGENGKPADVVLGQPDALSSLANQPPALFALQFQGPADVATDGTRLAVADSDNNRVLLWLKMPGDGNTPPDVVLGQPDFKSRQPNLGQPALGSGSLSAPLAVALDGGRLAVSDRANNRVLIWNQVPASGSVAPDVVLGQPGFVTNAQGLGPDHLSSPGPLRFDPAHGSLYVSELGNHRVLRFDPPLTTGMAASLVLGQADFTTGSFPAVAKRSGISPPERGAPSRAPADGVQSRGLSSTYAWRPCSGRSGPPILSPCGALSALPWSLSQLVSPL